MSRLEELIKEYCPDGVEYERIKGVKRAAGRACLHAKAAAHLTAERT